MSIPTISIGPSHGYAKETMIYDVCSAYTAVDQTYILAAIMHLIVDLYVSQPADVFENLLLLIAYCSDHRIES